MKNTSMNGWWDLYVDGEILTCILGRDRAEWFLEHMQVADPLAHWKLAPRVISKKVKPISPEEIQMRQEVTYCVGSD